MLCYDVKVSTYFWLWSVYETTIAFQEFCLYTHTIKSFERHAINDKHMFYFVDQSIYKIFSKLEQLWSNHIRILFSFFAWIILILTRIINWLITHFIVLALISKWHLGLNEDTEIVRNGSINVVKFDHFIFLTFICLTFFKGYYYELHYYNTSLDISDILKVAVALALLDTSLAPARWRHRGRCWGYRRKFTCCWLLVQTGRRGNRSYFLSDKKTEIITSALNKKELIFFLLVMDKLKKVLSGQDGNDDLNVLQVNYRGEIISTKDYLLSHLISLNQDI